ncbi:MAG: DUF1697 domain-containing protein [Gammaproteobacteria bacterium]|nr:DUF1697 domain-containing protein [Gammaproteobacteria bacterium]MDH5802152.1 DUF1697 domain-containing protein [Gammaproteobacteria bacterium]
MNTYVLLFRGINVGGRNTIHMKTLVDALTNCGCRHVKTYNQSGNVVLQNPTPPGESIWLSIGNAVGFSPDIITLSRLQFSNAVKNNPFTAKDGKTIHFYFYPIQAKPNITRLEKLRSPSEAYKIVDSVFYLYAPDGIGRSKLVAGLASCLDYSVTGRNLNTILKLDKLMSDIAREGV